MFPPGVVVEETAAAATEIETVAAIPPPPNSYTERASYFVLLSCLIACMGGILIGYDMGISGGLMSMDPFLKEMFPSAYTRMKQERAGNYCKFGNVDLAAFMWSLYMVALCASLMAGWLTRAFGRRQTMIAGGVSFLAGAMFSGVAVNVWMLLLGRILFGVGVGFVSQAIPVYLSEMAPPYDRGALSNGFQLSINIGFILASFVRFGSQQTGTWSWRILIALAATLACIFTFGSYYLLETPNSLVQRRDRFHNVVGTLQRIRGTADVVEELNDMIVAAYIPNPPMDSFRMIAQRSYRPQLIMAIAIPFFRQAAGYTLIAFYAAILFQTINFGDNISLSPALMLGLVATSANIMSIAMVDRMGRRVLFIIGGVSMFVSHLAMGGAMVGRFEDDGVMSKGYAYLILALMCVYVIGFELSWGPLGWSVPSEIFPLQIRSTAQSLVVALSFLFTVFVAQASLVLLCYIKSSIFFVFGGWVVAMTAFIYLFLPETKNVPIELMDQVWKVHWFWRRIVGDEPVQEGHPDHV